MSSNENQLYYPPASMVSVFFSGFCCPCIAGKQEDRGPSTPNRSRTLTVVFGRNAEIWFQSVAVAVVPEAITELLLLLRQTEQRARSTIMRLDRWKLH
jgi:hypothetical protein